MSKEKNVLDFYILATKLKDVIRHGWMSDHWNIQKDRLESVAEHVYGTCILAIGINSEYDLNIDINKVIKMLVVHELEEVLIGDVTPYSGVTPEEKIELGHEAVLKVLGNLVKKQEYYDLIVEFDSHETKESKFAFQFDKLEADLMSKVYQDGGYQKTLDKQEGNMAMSSTKVQDAIKEGATNPFEVWYYVDKDLYMNKEFRDILDYAKNNSMI